MTRLFSEHMYKAPERLRGLQGWHIALTGLVTTACLVGLILFWLVWPYRVLVFNRQIRVITPDVVAGGSLIYEMDYCKRDKYKYLYAEVQYSFVNHLLYNTPTMSGPLPTGCHVVTVWMEVPKLSPGTYMLEVTRTYRVNPLRQVVAQSRSIPFSIRAPGEPQAPPAPLASPPIIIGVKPNHSEAKQ